MTADPLLSRIPNRFGGYTQIIGGLPGNAPRGMERIDRDPRTRTCATRWADPSVFWAATTIGQDGAIYSGTLGGMTRWRPCDPRDDDCGRRLSLVRAVVGEDGFDRVGWQVALGVGGILLAALLAAAVLTRR